MEDIRSCRNKFMTSTLELEDGDVDKDEVVVVDNDILVVVVALVG